MGGGRGTGTLGSWCGGLTDCGNCTLGSDCRAVDEYGMLVGFAFVRWTARWRRCAMVVIAFYTSSPYARDGKEGGGF